MKNHQYIAGTVLCLSIGSVFIIGAACFIVSVLQLGLDQMPDASSSNINSFIVWLATVLLYVGMWINDFLLYSYWKCLRMTLESTPFPVFRFGA